MPFLPSDFNWFEELSLLSNWWGAIGLVATIILAVIIYFMFRHFNHLGHIVIRVALLAFFTYRIVLVVTYIGATGMFLNIVPWDVSSLCFFLLPLAILCDLPKFIKSQIALFSFFTGVVMLVGMTFSPLYFEANGTTAVLDALFSHILLILSPILLLVSDEVKFTWKSAILSVLLLAMLFGWGYLANLLLYPGHNIMHLVTSVFPFSITSIPALDYSIFILPVGIAFYIFMHLFNKHHGAYRKRRNLRLARENVLVKENRKERCAKKAAKRKQKREEREDEKISSTIEGKEWD